MTSVIEDRIADALSWYADLVDAPAAPAPTRHPRTTRPVAIATTAVLAGVAIATVAVISLHDPAPQTDISTSEVTEPDATLPATSSARAAFAALVLDAATRAGLTVPVDAAHADNDYRDPSGARYVETRLTTPEGGTILASARLDDPAATAESRTGSTVTTIDGIEIYPGTDGPTATAVTAVTTDPDQIVYVRSEDPIGPAPVETLGVVAADLALRWPQIAATMTFAPNADTATTIAPVPPPDPSKTTDDVPATDPASAAPSAISAAGVPYLWPSELPDGYEFATATSGIDGTEGYDLVAAVGHRGPDRQLQPVAVSIAPGSVSAFPGSVPGDQPQVWGLDATISTQQIPDGVTTTILTVPDGERTVLFQHAGTATPDALVAFANAVQVNETGEVSWRSNPLPDWTIEIALREYDVPIPNNYVTFRSPATGATLGVVVTAVPELAGWFGLLDSPLTPLNIDGHRGWALGHNLYVEGDGWYAFVQDSSMTTEQLSAVAASLVAATPDQRALFGAAAPDPAASQPHPPTSSD